MPASRIHMDAVERADDAVASGDWRRAGEVDVLDFGRLVEVDADELGRLPAG